MGEAGDRQADTLASLPRYVENGHLPGRVELVASRPAGPEEARRPRLKRPGAHADPMLMREPAIKGSVLGRLVEDVRRLRDERRLPPEELEARLDPPALALLDEKPLPSSWYPIESYRRLGELLFDVEGLRKPDYLRRRGAAVAEGLIRAGLYRQMSRIESATDIESYERSTRKVATLIGAIFNFGSVDVAIDPEHPRRVQITLSDVRPLPDILSVVMEGFFERIGAERGRRHRWRSERPAPDRVVFRMDRDLGS